MQPLITLRNDGAPLHRNIYESVRTGIRAGRLPPGTRLPSSRALAEQLGISRTPVLQAYAQLWAEGYVTGVTGSGTYVSETVPDRLIEATRPVGAADVGKGDRPIGLSRLARQILREEWSEIQLRPESTAEISFRVGQVAREDFPVRLWRRALGRQLERMDFGYGPAQGHRPLREEVRRYLATARAVECQIEDVFIVAGARRALDLVARLLVDPDAPVGIEEPHYPGARRILASAGARLIPLGVDEDGLDTSALDALPSDVRLVYVTPSHQYPTGGMLPVSRRLHLVEWAATTGAMIVEDDYDAEFQFALRPVEALKSIDRSGRVVYVGTFSKVLSPDLRVGYVVAPAGLREPLRRLIEVMDRQCPILLQGALAELFRDGHFERHVRRVRRRHAARREALLDALERHLASRVRVQGSAAGVHVLVWIPALPVHRVPDLVAEGHRRGVVLHPVATAFLGEVPTAGLVLGYGGLTESGIREGVRRLAAALRVVG